METETLSWIVPFTAAEERQWYKRFSQILYKSVQVERRFDHVDMFLCAYRRTEKNLHTSAVTKIIS